jgi:peptidyl-prolyl cis-trans isomerase A (cyclophilin A)
MTMRRRGFLAAAGAAAAWPAYGAEPTTGLKAVGLVGVEMVTGAGTLILEVDSDKAPITALNFLRYVYMRLYDGSKIYRALKSPTSPPTGLIQGGAKYDPARSPPPIQHESTTLTGIKHKDGTISLARRALGTATSDFFICVGDAPYLDANPSAPGDNQGFAAFGHVKEGMDIARQILAMPTSPTAGAPEMAGQMLEPPVPIISARRL